MRKSLAGALIFLAGAALAAVKHSWVIIPGERVGEILPASSEADLRRVYGDDNVKLFPVYLGGRNTEMGTALFPNDPMRRLEILWQDPEKKERVKSIRVAGKKSLWKTREGLTLGVSLDMLEIVNGKPFYVSGFGWDGGGAILSWNGGFLESKMYQGGQVIFRLKAPKTLKPEERAAIEGDKQILSNDKVLRRLNPVVYQIIIEFN